MTQSHDLEATTQTWEARARAAERTVDVLKHKVVDLYNGASSNIQHTVERAREREVESRRRQELMAFRNAELTRHSASLELEVARRTRDLQAILDNVVFGFLVVGGDGVVRDGFTRSCVDLLGRDGIAGASLGAALGFDAAHCADLALGLSQVFDDILPTELVLDQLPRRATGADGRSLRLDGRVIRGGDGAVDAILITISDVTALEAAQHENARYRLLVQLLRQREAFVSFVTDFRALARDAYAAVAASDDQLARRAIHTMKGNAACFGLAEVAQLAHTVEDARAIDRAGISCIERALDDFLRHNVDVLGITADSDAATSISITPEDLAALETALVQPGAAAAWLERVRRRPARVMLAPLEALVPRLAERFAKRVELVVEGGDLRVDADVLAPVVRELGHVVRNAIDHGIEPADQRAGKAGVARICIRFAEQTTDYQIEIEDDGRGIDVDGLRTRARAMGLHDEATLATRTYEELLDLVFVDGLSTATTTTDVSGRGVGMSAICAAVNRVGGTIRVRSQPRNGTCIEIRVPRTGAAVHGVAA
jgi:two-component system chemotaxis sensor kinase CheA